MNALLISIALAVTMFTDANQSPREKDSGRAAIQKIDGDWSVTYVEMDGKKLEGKGFTHVTIKNNVVTCRHDGKEKSWRLEFGPHNMVRCTEQTDGKTATDTTRETRDLSDKSHHTHHGVYIASQEYFSLSLNKGRDRRTIAATESSSAGQSRNERGSASRFGEHGPHGAHFVLILHRGGSNSTTGSR